MSSDTDLVYEKGRIVVRAATPDDAPVLVGMVAALAAFNDDVATLDAATVQADAFGDAPWVWFLIAEAEGVPVGYAALCRSVQLHFARRCMDLHHLFVADGMRGRGVGGALIRASAKRAAGMGCARLTVSTHATNLAAQGAYLASGFTRLNTHPPRFAMELQPTA